MPVGRMGPRCERCGSRPADHDSPLCRSCDSLLAAFGHHRDPDAPVIILAGTPEFDVELRRWLDAA